MIGGKVLSKTKDMLINLGLSNCLEPEDYKSIDKRKILLGDNDNMVTEEESKIIAQHLTSGSFEILPNSAHPIEKTDLNNLQTLKCTILLLLLVQTQVKHLFRLF